MKIRKLLAIMIAAVMLLAAFGCSTSNTSSAISSAVSSEEVKTPDSVTVGALQGPTALSVLKMWDDQTTIGGQVPAYSLFSSPEELVAAVSKGEFDFAFLPLNTAAKLYNKGTDYRLVGVNTWGNMYVISTDDSIKTIADLSGKTVAVSQQGATPDVVMRYCLQQAGLTDSVTLDYTLVAHADLAASVISGGTTIALMPEPFVTNIMLKNENVHIVLDVQQLWADATGGDAGIPQGAIVVKGSFADEYPQAVVDFIKAQTASVEYAVSDPTGNSELAAAHGVTIPAAAIINGTARCNLSFKTTGAARTRIDSYFNIILGFSPTDIGGVLPSEAFFATFEQ